MNKIKYLIMDVDGTLTDGKIYMGQDGEIAKAFSIKDGTGIVLLARPNGIEPIIITGRHSSIVENRCRELGITELYQGIDNKSLKLVEIVDEISSCAYIGDDLNDLDAMYLIKEHGGIVGCPRDACEQVKEISDYICCNNGGNGCVREFIEFIISTCIKKCVDYYAKEQ